jgi:hypothetical protein
VQPAVAYVAEDEPALLRLVLRIVANARDEVALLAGHVKVRLAELLLPPVVVVFVVVNALPALDLSLGLGRDGRRALGRVRLGDPARLVFGRGRAIARLGPLLPLLLAVRLVLGADEVARDRAVGKVQDAVAGEEEGDAVALAGADLVRPVQSVNFVTFRKPRPHGVAPGPKRGLVLPGERERARVGDNVLEPREQLQGCGEPSTWGRREKKEGERIQAFVR